LYTGCAKRSLLTTHSAAPDSASLSLHDALPIFAEGVAQLAALDEKLEAIHQARVAVFAARQGRGLGRIVQDEHGDALLAARVAVVLREERLGQVLVGDEQPLPGVVTNAEPLAEVPPVDATGTFARPSEAPDELIRGARRRWFRSGRAAARLDGDFLQSVQQVDRQTGSLGRAARRLLERHPGEGLVE